MTEKSTSPQQASEGRLLCRLRSKSTEGCVYAGEVEIENVSDEPIEIVIQASELEHLDLLVTNDRGEVVSAFHYGIIFSPFSLGHTWQLLPGHKLVRSVNLLATVPEEKRKPGRYSVQAVYVYEQLHAVSERIEFDLPPANPSSLKGRNWVGFCQSWSKWWKRTAGPH